MEHLEIERKYLIRMPDAALLSRLLFSLEGPLRTALGHARRAAAETLTKLRP